MRNGSLYIVLIWLAFVNFGFCGVQEDFEDAWVHYQGRVRQNASVQERLDLLTKIETKFSSQDFDLTLVRNEKAKLNAQLPKSAAPPVDPDQQLKNFKADWFDYEKESPDLNIVEKVERLEKMVSAYGDIPLAQEKIKAEKKRLAENSAIPQPSPPEVKAESRPAAKPVVHEDAKKPRKQKKVRWFGQVEVWTPGDAYEEYDEDLQGLIGSLGNSYGAANGNFDDKAGSGLRGGFLYAPHMPGFEIGASLGFVKGPEMKTTLNIHDLFFGDSAKLTEEIESRFLRALFEMQKRLPMSDRAGWNLRGGIGFGTVRLDGKFSASGFLVGEDSYSSSDVGLTWEIFPSFYLDAGSVSWDIGLGYAQFPKFKEDDNFFDINWEPVGLRVSATF